MANTSVKDAGKKVLDAWQNTKKSQKILIVAVIVLTIIAISVVVSMANQVEYDTLFTGLSNEDAGKVQAALQEEGIDVKASGNGTLLVPKAQVDELRYKMQADGILTGDTLDHSIYSTNASAFGATDADKKYYERAQMEQNIARTINRLDKIKSSIVMLTLAEESKFAIPESGNTESTAAVTITLKSSNEQLSDSDVAAVRAIVSKAVPSLKEENIAIVDQNMHSYPMAGDMSGGTTAVDTQIALQNKVASGLEQQIVALLTPVFGAENISSNVHALLDFDKTTTNSLTLSPPTRDAVNTGIVTSMKQTTERLMNAGQVAQGEPGMDPNGGGATYQEIDTAAQDDKYYNVVTEVNYEVNEISEQIEQAQGDITDISATVILNGGDEMADILPQIRTMIATAVGIPEGKITVSSMPFEGTAAYQQMMEEETKKMEEAQQAATIQSMILPLAIVAGIVIILLILISSFRKKREADRAEQLRQDEVMAMQMAAAGVPGGVIDVTADEDFSIEDLLKEKNDNMLKQVQALVEKNPEVIAQLLRNWLTDDLGGGLG